MAINDVVVDGLGFNDGQIGFLLTQGFGSFTESGSGTGTVFPMGLGVGLWGLRARRIAAILGGGGR